MNKQGNFFTVVHDQRIILTPYPNGGWTITLETPPACNDMLFGAYTTHAGMVTGLKDYLKNGND